MYKLLLALITIFVLAAHMSTQSQTPNDKQLQELLAKTTASLGGAEKLRAMQSFSMTGTFRRAFPDHERAGDYELSFKSPDNFRKIETADAAKGVQLVLTSMLNQNEGWSDTSVRTSGIEVNTVARQPNTPNARRQVRANFAPHLLPWLLAAPESNAIQFSYQKREGNGLVLDVRGPDNFFARVVLDPKTYLPVEMSYRSRPTVIVLDLSQVPETPPSETEIDVRFADYRTEDGIVLPHRITVGSSGKFLEEFELKSCRTN